MRIMDITNAIYGYPEFDLYGYIYKNFVLDVFHSVMGTWIKYGVMSCNS